MYELFFDNDSSDDYIGSDGEHTSEQKKRHRQNRQFWDVSTDDIQLHGLHGNVIADDAKMVPMVAFMFGAPPADAQWIVDHVQETIAADPGFDLDSQLLSFNAVAFSVEGEEIPGLGVLPDKIVMGDGLLEFLDYAGFGTNGPDFVHAHEFAHHVQGELGVFDNHEGTPETTRRTEMMADAFAAYELAHARGASMQSKRITEPVSAAFDAGDCGFDDPNHHGTPNQRAAAAAWGAGFANEAQPKSRIISPETMPDLFDAELPPLVAPDAG